MLGIAYENMSVMYTTDMTGQGTIFISLLFYLCLIVNNNNIVFDITAFPTSWLYL